MPEYKIAIRRQRASVPELRARFKSRHEWQCRRVYQHKRNSVVDSVQMLFAHSRTTDRHRYAPYIIRIHLPLYGAGSPAQRNTVSFVGFDTSVTFVSVTSYHPETSTRDVTFAGALDGKVKSATQASQTT